LKAYHVLYAAEYWFPAPLAEREAKINTYETAIVR
jgi:hypothetical protein